MSEGTLAAKNVCPVCGNRMRPLPVIYGYPSTELFEEAEAGKVRLGGCIVSGDEPTHVCPLCESELDVGQDGALTPHVRTGDGHRWR